MEFVWLIIFGAIAGGLGKLLMPGKDPGGFIATVLLGIAGSIVGYFAFRAIGIGDDDKFDILGLPGAVIGVMLLLWLYRKFIDQPGKSDAAATV
jgi:uncharacterized membrane protein YeaQ/YmgE (transglycosylase-associated protein family)